MAGDLELEDLLPPKPTEPLDSECCGTGCSPCVFDIYKKQLKRWENDCEDIRLNGHNNFNISTDSADTFLTPEKYIAFKITKIHLETPTSNIYSFSCDNCPIHLRAEKNFPIKIGQHVLIRQENISKQYTVLRHNRTDNVFEVLIKIYPQGVLTTSIGKLSVGDSIEMRGPFGNAFVYNRNSMKNVVMLSAGTGIAPMYRIIENILNDEEDDTKIKLIFACKSLIEVPLKTKFKEWSSYWNFDVLYYLNHQMEDTVCKVQSENGVPYYGMKSYFKRINCDELKEQCKDCDVSKTLFLICGTKSFEKDMLNYLQKLDVGLSNIVVF